MVGDELDFSGMVGDENTASAMCYTTGTTGNPKGVLYSHRSTYLHSLCTQTQATFALASRTSRCRSCRCSTRWPGACRTPA